MDGQEDDEAEAEEEVAELEELVGAVSKAVSDASCLFGVRRTNLMNEGDMKVMYVREMRAREPANHVPFLVHAVWTSPLLVL